MNGFIDLHCHCLPGIDDGAADMDTALALCRKLADEGVTTVAATPHQLGRYEGRNGAPAIRVAVAELAARLAAEDIALGLVPGADVRVAEDLPALIAADEVMTLADGRKWMLVEPAEGAFMDLGPLLDRLRALGIRGIVTHPERYLWNDAAIGKMLQWRRSRGALMQITAGSFLGAFGPRAEMLAWRWLENGLADLVASDAHDTIRRPPLLAAAWKAISARAGEAVAQRVMVSAPARLLAESQSAAAARAVAAHALSN
jgi:protein-tyrosine phosphatase